MNVHDAQPGVSGTEIIIDAKSGSSLVIKPTVTEEDDHTKSENTYTKKRKWHTMFNPELTESEALAEINSVKDNPEFEVPDPRTGKRRPSRKFVGQSAQGQQITVITDRKDGTIVTAFPELTRLKDMVMIERRKAEARLKSTKNDA